MLEVVENMSSVTVVVINFDGKHHLEECLRSVQEADGPICQVILVDDCSTDGSVEFVARRFPEVKVIRLTQNQGPSAARNAGIEAAQTRWVCLLDNDIIVDQEWLIPLIETMTGEENVAICSSRILLYERPDTIGTNGEDAHFVGMPTSRNAWCRSSEVDDSTPQEIGAALGISLLIDKSRVKRSSYFDPDFFYNFEDLDFCLRNQMLGYRCLVVPQSIIYHKYLTGGVPGLSSSQPGYSPRRAYYVFRNRWFVILKCYAPRTLFVLAPALLLFELVTVVFAVRKRVFRSYVRAWKSLRQGLPGILRKRRAIQATRVVSDRVLLSASRLTLGQGTVQEGAFESNLASLFSSILQMYWALVRRLL
jgi:GT2 family glycosyltransferase